MDSTSHMEYKDLMNEKGCHSLLNFELQMEMENYEMFHLYFFPEFLDLRLLK